ncbi:glycosyltransferase [Phyllobacterium sp. YR531]|uniref:glycosyltransferase family protein n=1 Tax=Phyllobacterium sp. YR531 TaxID=1144343 RepID=UPI00026F6381|nr:glycosyltransferase [Phyllobacterium sp. YR531]EJN06212.1 putative glycosyl transferase [Phyllobacterium sp. YR531]
MTSPRVFFYVQHLLGIGHLARASHIARALVDNGFDLTMVTGGSNVPGFPGHGIRKIALPPLLAGNAGFSGLVDGNSQPASEDYLNNRRELLLHAFHEAKPDIVIIEAFPFGRRQMRFELMPLLEAIKSTVPKPILVTSVRDILQERAKPGRDEETVSLIKSHFDHVLVHGDPNFVALHDTFPLAKSITDKIIYTGLVAGSVAQPSPDKFDIVVSAGGGAVGFDLLRSASESARQSSFQGTWCLITGPNLPEADFARLYADSPENVTIVRFRQDFPALLQNARLSISQAGYNTVCDMLRAQCRSILVPFTAGGETEQSVRATRLEALGLAVALPENGLTAAMLTGAITSALDLASRPEHNLDLNGARQTAALLGQML